MGGRVLYVHAAQQRGRGGAGAAQLPATLFAHAVCVVHQPLTRGAAAQRPTCGLPRALSPPGPSASLRHAWGGARPLPGASGAVQSPCVQPARFCVPSSVLVCVCVPFIRLFIDCRGCNYQFTHLLLKCPVSGTRLPSSASSHHAGGRGDGHWHCPWGRDQRGLCRPEGTDR